MTDRSLFSIASQSLRERFSSILPRERILDDALSLTAIATDASFYQIYPQIILDVLSSDEMVRVLEVCARDRLPVTYRAAGTSLSGQALGEGVLIRIARGWRGIRVLDDGFRIALEPGVIGATANRALKKFQRKIGPDPATIQSCMIGGIAANNSSGMCCGTDQNTYRTMDSMKLMLVPEKDGTAALLDTGDQASREAFRARHASLLEKLSQLRAEVYAQPELLELIRKKYKIKNTMGYSLNSLVDFEDPIDILSHLMIGSEGTLGFISEITYQTVPDYRHRSCALLFFETLGDACRAATRLKSVPVVAAELMDRTSLKKVEDKPGMPAILKGLDPKVAALLIETRAEDGDTLATQVQAIERLFPEFKLAHAPYFSADPVVYETWWNIRRGLFPSIGKGRIAGTTVIIEDVAFPMEGLAEATEALVGLLKKHGYEEAILFGHVLDGNFHFCFAQDFNASSEVARYAGLMAGLGELVTSRSGSLKAEHGTGRNMAPFVELEWGSEAYSLMKRLKRAIDPLSIFNPGVMLNESPTVHLEDLKTTPKVDSLIDECIECGFCEVHCPSVDLTVTPRQRIAAFREFTRTGDARYESLMQYPVEQTCAADGLCSVACPVSIDTGAFVKKYRARKRSFDGIAKIIARYFSLALSCVHFGLRFLSRFKREIPRAAPPFQVLPSQGFNQKVVYLPSCISRTMGSARVDADPRSLPEVMHSLFKKAKVDVLYPENLPSTCCGLPFESKGFPVQGDEKAHELEKALLQASQNGLYPIISDTSPCTQHLKKKLDPRLKILDSVEFMHDLILNARLPVQQTDRSVAVHVTCSAVHMGISQKLISLAEACSTRVTVPIDVGCCGFAGDKGFTHPELTRSALSKLSEQVKGRCGQGFSNSRTCEIGLTRESEISYQSIAYLVDQVT
jgi:D-lactate dehydrogenase